MEINEEKVEKALVKIGLDALGICGCVFVASELPDFIPLLRGSQLFLSAMAGIWLYVPIRKIIDKVVDKAIEKYNE